jgi:intracellular septation protein
MLWVSLAIIVVFGGATLLLRDETFIKWKPTVLYWLFGAVLAGAALAGRNLIRGLLSEQMSLPDPIWARLNWSWVGFFVVMGLLNLYVAYNFSEKVWASFKLFGGMGLMLLFVVAQSAFLAKYVEDKQ